MIQIRRGKTAAWRNSRLKLAAGQPGYDKDKHKIKIGDGNALWTELPYASGLSEEEIFDSERNAKNRILRDSEDRTIITHGSDGPNASTVGKIYLQSYDTAPEVDYVVEFGADGIWQYRKWHSGRAECTGTLKLATTITNEFDNGLLFYNNKDMNCKKYPVTFKDAPHESASVQSTGTIVWLAGNTKNTKTETGKYKLISPYACESEADYYITFHVSGYCD